VLRPISRYLKPPEENESKTCLHDWKKETEAPMVLQASFADGQRMKGTGSDAQAYQRLIESSELKVELAQANHKSDDAKKIKKEIRALEKA
jgi:hypothetical protein